MNILGVIPARYDSTRLKGKPLELINEKPLIQWVFESAIKYKKFKEVIIATDNEEIKKTALSFGANVCMTDKSHNSGTDRIAEVALKFNKNIDIIVNIQGDQLNFSKGVIEKLISPFEKNSLLKMSTIGSSLLEEERNNPNTVKVLVDKKNYAIYFSRASIPYIKEKISIPVLSHIGMYAYNRDFLLKFSKLKPSNLEICESLEQLRAFTYQKLKIKFLKLIL